MAAISVTHEVFSAPWKPGSSDLGHAKDVHHFSGGGDTVPPTVSVISPAPGGRIGKTDAITVEAADNAAQPRRVILVVALPGGIEEIAHNGDRFGPKYLGVNNTITSITNGYRYTLLRDGGWPGSPTLWAEVIDRGGNENA